MSKKFSAADVAEVVDSLTKAGLTPEQIVDGVLVGALYLADAGDLEPFRAADISAAIANRFDLRITGTKISPLCGNGTFTVRTSESAINAAKRAVERGRFAEGGVIA